MIPAPRPSCARAARPARLHAILVAPLLLLALACGGDASEDDAGADAASVVSAASSGVTTSTPTPSPTGALEGEELEIAIWGQEVCGVARAFALDFLASGDPREPGSLDLAARKQRAAAMFPVQIDVVGEALAHLDEIEAPERTAEFHALLQQTYQELRDALVEQEVVVRDATTHEEIAESNLGVDDLMNLAFRQGALLENAGYCGANGDPA